MKDVENQYAPIVTPSKDNTATQEVAETKEVEAQKLIGNTVPIATIDGPTGPNNFRNIIDMPGVNNDRAIEGQQTHEQHHQPPRGFSGKQYDSLPEEIYTEVDVTRLIHFLKKTAGIEVLSVSPLIPPNIHVSFTLASVFEHGCRTLCM